MRLPELAIPRTRDRMNRTVYPLPGLRRVREEAGLSQSELARRLGLMRCNLIKLERGQHRARRSTVLGLAVALGVSPSDLVIERIAS